VHEQRRHGRGTRINLRMVRRTHGLALYSRGRSSSASHAGDARTHERSASFYCRTLESSCRTWKITQ
jgi:hypothetical protein